MNITRIKNDINGNGRMVVHFTEFNVDCGKYNEIWTIGGGIDLTNNYDLAVYLASCIGGKRYHSNSYGGGIVFQSYSQKELGLKIKDAVANAKKALLRDKAGYTESDARIICKYEGRTKRRVKNGWKMFFDGNFVEFLPKVKYELPQ
jgi:hypothetical protein